MSENIKKLDKNKVKQMPVRIREYAEFYYECGVDNLSEFNDYDRAIVDFSEAIRINPDYVEAYQRRGIAYKEKGDNENAIADFTTAISLDPTDYHYYIYRADAKKAMGDYQAAIADWDAIVGLYPDDYNAYFFRGEELYKIGRYGQAISDFTAAIGLNPDKDYLFTSRAKARVAMGNYQGAIADYDAAIVKNPSHILYSLRGDIHMVMKNYLAAYEDYSIVAKITKDSLFFDYYEKKLKEARAMLRAELGDNIVAIADSDTIISIAPKLYSFLSYQDYVSSIEQNYLPFSDNSIIEVGPYTKFDKDGWPIIE